MQEHVSYPRQKQMLQKNGTKKTYMQRNKSELETIMEKAKEEEVAMSMSNVNMQKMDIEESYSFSLRNYGAPRTKDHHK